VLLAIVVVNQSIMGPPPLPDNKLSTRPSHFWPIRRQSHKAHRFGFISIDLTVQLREQLAQRQGEAGCHGYTPWHPAT
jgi:hypothetical protein